MENEEAFMVYVYAKEYKTPKLDLFDNVILAIIMEKGTASVYQVHSYLEASGQKVTYKSLHYRIARKLFKKEHVIERAEVRNAKHGAIYYRLSTQGWFYFIKERVNRQKVLESIPDYYDKNSILNDWIVPYFELDTLRTLINKYKISFEIVPAINTLTENKKRVGGLGTTLLNSIALYLEMYSDVAVTILRDIACHPLIKKITNDEVLAKYAVIQLDAHAKLYLVANLLLAINTLVKGSLAIMDTEEEEVLKIISRDKKFMKLLDDSRIGLEAGYNKLMELRMKD